MTMKELEVLLNNRWILKSKDKEMYYKVRDALGELRKFTTEKMGCQIIDNSLLIKMEKIPVIPETFMGIQKFSSKEEYAYLCILLMFLEDKDANEQFILSQLTEYITANMPGELSDWTLYTNRRKLIRVLRYAVDQGIVGLTDGKDEAFMDDEAGEVLYENTGASRYFMKSFSKDIMEYTKPEDFQESDWFEVDEDRGFARRHRVYKRLIFAPGMYKEDGSPEDFEYLKYYGRRLSEELEQIFDCHVHIHRGSAFLLSGEDCRMGTDFPGNNSISDILLLCFGEIRKRIKSGEWKTRQDEMCLIDQIEFENLIKKVKQEYGSGFSKNYREMPEGEFVRSVMEEMKLWMFIKSEAASHQVRICPLAGKIQGRYPEDYAGGSKDE
ncbi:MAG: TIGR02678 family protein [Oliverpabstia sp.]